MLPTKFQVNWLLGSGEVKNRFSRWLPWRPSAISDRNDFCFFLIYKSPRCFLQSFKSIRPSVQEKKRNIDFQDGRHCSQLGFLIGLILAIKIYKSPRCFLPGFKSIGLLVQEIGFPIGTILANFYPNASYQVSSQLALRFRR